MNNELVSVIIAVKDGERFLAEAIDGVLEQTYRPLEVIVVDDGSTDGTAEVARSFEEVQYIYQTNRGHAAALNVGLRRAAGQFLAFLDADDVWEPNKLELQVGYLMENPAVDLVIARTQNFLEPGAQLPAILTKDLSLEDSVLLSLGALVGRRAVFDVVGAFDESYEHAKDVDWFIRAREAGLRMAILPDILLRRRLHGSNRSFSQQSRKLEFMRAVRSSIERGRAAGCPEGNAARSDSQAAPDDRSPSS
jgi:glycosyltransferase involved in cell wall biosynthesis